MKISKTQAEILEKAKKTIAILREYKDYTDFFNNCEANKQNTFTTASRCNGAWNNSEI